MAFVGEWTLPRAVAREWELRLVGPESPAAAVPTDIGDAELVAACLREERGAFDLVVARHQRAIYQLCYRFVPNHEDASDLTQDVFLRAYKGLRNFRGQSSLGTWLYRIGVNVCLNRLSAKAVPTEPVEERHHVDTRSESAPDRLMRTERAARVRAAIAQLPRKQRAALILRMYHDMAHHEIAEALGSSVGAVKANVFHAVQNLKKLIGDGI